ncbi:MAG: 1-deoxy-D-xylulose-5-phosphate synthase [Cellulosilyticaceae bacterium]
MLKTLARIKGSSDVKALTTEELPLLAKDIRSFLVQSLSKTGGHLSSNLGIVELTIAMHYVFNSPEDEFVWDVGHQAYVHKLLTGRRKGFKSLRQYGGMSGFPKRSESAHDCFETGHSSTSISAALGLAVARDLKGEHHHVLAVIGDGALTGGMAYEALNNAGRGHTNLIVILNDNEMSIAENVGGMGRYLNRLRSTKEYARAKEDVQGILGSIPVVGDGLVNTVRRTKEGLKTFLIDNTLFEQMGFTYLGPIDGHDFEGLIEMLENAKGMKGPIIIHVKTKKGRGYRLAEENPSLYHGVGPFDMKEGVQSKLGGKNFSGAFGDAMVKLGADHKELVAITAAMSDGTGLVPFEKTYPDRFFDVGIAEQHAVTFAAGLAVKGYRPVVAVYSSFLQRAYDQVLHDVALQNLPVIFCIDRAGLVGEDGSTHQGIYDIAYLSHIPNITFLSVKMPEEMEDALKYALTCKGPVAIRYPRGTTQIDAKYQIDYTNVGLHVLEEGTKVAVLATGKAVEWALNVRAYLLDKGVDVTVVEAPCITPVDGEGLEALGDQYEVIFTMEDHIAASGFGSLIAKHLKCAGKSAAVVNFAYENGIIHHGAVPRLLEEQQMSPEQLGEQILAYIQKES